MRLGTKQAQRYGGPGSPARALRCRGVTVRLPPVLPQSIKAFKNVCALRGKGGCTIFQELCSRRAVPCSKKAIRDGSHRLGERTDGSGVMISAHGCSDSLAGGHSRCNGAQHRDGGRCGMSVFRKLCPNLRPFRGTARCAHPRRQCSAYVSKRA